MSNTKDSNPKQSAGNSRVPLDLIPTTGLVYAAMSFAEGASKYTAANWRIAGVRFSTYHAAMMRHMLKVANGEWVDPETNVPHLGSIIGSAMILADAHEIGNLNDDRAPALNVGAIMKRAEAVIAHVRELNRDANPKSLEELNGGPVQRVLVQAVPSNEVEDLKRELDHIRRERDEWARLYHEVSDHLSAERGE